MARVLLGVTGGIAAYKACELLRLLVTDGHDALLVPPARPDRLADALVALANDPAARDRLAAHARGQGSANPDTRLAGTSHTCALEDGLEDQRTTAPHLHAR